LNSSLTLAAGELWPEIMASGHHSGELCLEAIVVAGVGIKETVHAQTIRWNIVATSCARHSLLLLYRWTVCNQ